MELGRRVVGNLVGRTVGLLPGNLVGAKVRFVGLAVFLTGSTGFLVGALVGFLVGDEIGAGVA
jgi:hypothetical protein